MPIKPLCLLALEDRTGGVDFGNDAAALGFDGIILASRRGPFDGRVALPRKKRSLTTFVTLDLCHVPIDHPLVPAYPDAFALRRTGDDAVVDPRRPIPMTGSARARLSVPEAWAVLREPFFTALRDLVATGVSGLRLIGAASAGAVCLADIRAAFPGLSLIAQLDGAPPEGLDGLIVTIAPDQGASSLVEAHQALNAVAPVLVEVETSDDLRAAAALSDGLIVPVAMLAGTRAAVRDAVAMVKRMPRGAIRRLSGPGAPVAIVVRADADDIRAARHAALVLINTTDAPRDIPDPANWLPFAGADFAPFDLPSAPLEPHGVVVAVAERARAILRATVGDGDAARQPRLVLESIAPRVDGGDFPVKRVVGEDVVVEAVLYGDGHEQLAAELQWRAGDEDEWHTAPMAQLPNDLWRAKMPLWRLGRHEYAIEGWLDRFGGFQRDFAKKRDAGVAQAVDHAEGRALIAAGLSRADNARRFVIAEHLAAIDAARDDDAGAALLLAPELAALMADVDDRPHRIRCEPIPIDAERLQARFSSWYELFPRSQTDDKGRHGTFSDVIGRLPAIRAMGFDTLYFPPIHPIGTTNRKGPNNTLTPGPDDVGSPYAIGGAEGGHDAIHPALGSFAEFAELVVAARVHGLEIALDFAIQCSPDHPWLKEHPGWFAWRPDGSMKYAENPPKKYQDIVNVDFYAAEAVPGLWRALRDIVLLWIEHGVKTFRVDNPHTKPLPFWEWMIGVVRARHPEVIFLAEAFTRPNMMYRLAKIGFSQSYTYFTWRDHKQELIDYIVELTTTAPKDFYRPHFFVNTPDINPPFLQTSGRAGFRIRAALAATLSGLFGVYSGFELCEAAPVPGREEYLDSEKYEIRPRDWQAPGNIVDDITLLNRLRRDHPALQTHLNTRFYLAHDDAIIYYGKPSPDGAEMILVMVSLDPHHPREADFEVPLWEFGLHDDAVIVAEDLARGGRQAWRGKMQHIRIEPDEPYRIWRIGGGA